MVNKVFACMIMVIRVTACQNKHRERNGCALGVCALDVIHRPECCNLIFDGKHFRFKFTGHAGDVHVKAWIERLGKAFTQIQAIDTKHVALVAVVNVIILMM